ncbi:MAG TPA: nitrate reductase molybdenum cofactor assembly chaperone, partial [Sphingomonadales bacterium]|nr:nitrate reductase molybdenum cofactor assembly chaperone [Sphingomonadales bacterium]
PPSRSADRGEQAMKTFKVLSILLSYPREGFREQSFALRQALEAENLLSASAREGIEGLIGTLAEADILDAEEAYCFLFDRTRSLSLHLFEHVHGESRDRGQAMVDLLELYRKAGFDVDAAELPDYVPLFLEYLSLCPLEEARALLAEPLHILAALRARLEKRKSPYAAVFQALEELAGKQAEAGKVEQILENEPDTDPTDPRALDQAWTETEVRFGRDAGSEGCPKMKEIVETLKRETPGRASKRQESA